MKQFKNKIWQEIEENNFDINESIAKKIRFFFFSLKITPNKEKLMNLEESIDSMLEQQLPLNKEKIKNFIEKNEEIGSYFSIENETLIFEYDNHKYKFNIDLLNFAKNEFCRTPPV